MKTLLKSNTKLFHFFEVSCTGFWPVCLVKWKAPSPLICMGCKLHWGQAMWTTFSSCLYLGHILHGSKSARWIWKHLEQQVVCDEGDVVEAEVVEDIEVAVVDTDIKDVTTAVEVDVEDIEGVVEVVAQEPGLITPSMVMRNYYLRIFLMDPPWYDVLKW